VVTVLVEVVEVVEVVAVEQSQAMVTVAVGIVEVGANWATL